LLLNGNGSTSILDLSSHWNPASALVKRGTGTFTLTATTSPTREPIAGSRTLWSTEQPNSDVSSSPEVRSGGVGSVGVEGKQHWQPGAWRQSRPADEPEHQARPGSISASRSMLDSRHRPRPAERDRTVDLNGALLLPTKGVGYAPAMAM